MRPSSRLVISIVPFLVMLGHANIASAQTPEARTNSP